MSRPRATARAHIWKAKDTTETPGIALWGGGRLAAHLTYTEARRLADKLHDMSDRLDAGTPQPTTPDHP